MTAQKSAAQALAKVKPYDQKHLERRMAEVFAKWGKELTTERLKVMELQLHGGPCPVCQKGWIPTHVEEWGRAWNEKLQQWVNQQLFADFTLFRPSCRCFKTCTVAGILVKVGGGKEILLRRPGCGALLVEERLLQLNHEQKTCLNCGGVIL